MKLTKVLMTAALPLALSLACGGSASDSGDGDGDGDGDSSGDGDTGGDGDGDGDGGPTTSDGKDEVCEEFCEEVEACEGIVIEDCVDSCTGNSTTSRNGQAVVNECFTADLCEAPTEEAAILGLICLVDGAGDLDLSDEAETYCGESVDTINRCLMSEPAAEDALGSCEDTIGIVSDELLADLNECASRPCDEIEACLNLAFITSIPLGTLLELEDGGEPSPAVIAELIPILIAFGQLGLDDSGAGDFFGGMDGTAGGPQN